MTHYSDKPYMVRVDIFKPSGKWYETISVSMKDKYHTADLHEALRSAILVRRTIADNWLYVCLDPYHKHSHPIILRG